MEEDTSRSRARSSSGSAPVRRPMNAFLIFCKRHRSLVREKNPHLDNRSVTRILGELWANLPPEEKTSFTSLANEYKEAFMRANPDYKWFNPEKSGQREKPSTRPTNQLTSYTGQVPHTEDSPLPSPSKYADGSDGSFSMLLMAGQQALASTAAFPTSVTYSLPAAQQLPQQPATKSQPAHPSGQPTPNAVKPGGVIYSPPQSEPSNSGGPETFKAYIPNLVPHLPGAAVATTDGTSKERPAHVSLLELAKMCSNEMDKKDSAPQPKASQNPAGHMTGHHGDQAEAMLTPPWSPKSFARTVGQERLNLQSLDTPHQAWQTYAPTSNSRSSAETEHYASSTAAVDLKSSEAKWGTQTPDCPAKSNSKTNPEIDNKSKDIQIKSLNLSTKPQKDKSQSSHMTPVASSDAKGDSKDATYPNVNYTKLDMPVNLSKGNMSRENLGKLVMEHVIESMYSHQRQQERLALERSAQERVHLERRAPKESSQLAEHVATEGAATTHEHGMLSHEHRAEARTIPLARPDLQHHSSAYVNPGALQHSQNRSVPMTTQQPAIPPHAATLPVRSPAAAMMDRPTQVPKAVSAPVARDTANKVALTFGEIQETLIRQAVENSYDLGISPGNKNFQSRFAKRAISQEADKENQHVYDKNAKNNLHNMHDVETVKTTGACGTVCDQIGQDSLGKMVTTSDGVDVQPPNSMPMESSVHTQVDTKHKPQAVDNLSAKFTRCDLSQIPYEAVQGHHDDAASSTDDSNHDNQGMDTEDGSIVRKSKRSNRGRRYQELIEQGYLQKSRDKSMPAPYKSENEGHPVPSEPVVAQLPPEKPSVEQRDSKTSECTVTSSVPGVASAPAKPPTKISFTSCDVPRPRSPESEAIMKSSRKRHCSEADIGKKRDALDKRYKTGTFDLDAHIACLPACRIEDLSRRIRHKSGGHGFPAGHVKVRHHSDSSTLRRRASVQERMVNAAELRAIVATETSQPKRPVTGSQKRKARRTAITHLIPVRSAGARQEPPANETKTTAVTDPFRPPSEPVVKASVIAMTTLSHLENSAAVSSPVVVSCPS